MRGGFVRFSVGSRGKPSVEVEADNWLIALGMAIADDLGAVQRLGCEILENGTVIVRDAATGAGWIVQRPEIAGFVEAADDALELGGEQEPASRYQAVFDAPSDADACVVALDLARDATGADGGVVWQVVDDGLWALAAAGVRAEKLAGLVLPPGVGLAADVVRTGHILLLADAAADPRHFAEPDWRIGVPARDVLCVPLARGAASIGALELGELGEGRRFSRAAIHEVRGIADALATRLR